jgi:hypothetical protein
MGSRLLSFRNFSLAHALEYVHALGEVDGIVGRAETQDGEHGISPALTSVRTSAGLVSKTSNSSRVNRTPFATAFEYFMRRISNFTILPDGAPREAHRCLLQSGGREPSRLLSGRQVLSNCRSRARPAPPFFRQVADLGVCVQIGGHRILARRSQPQGTSVRSRCERPGHSGRELSP